ncbi:NADH:ubiquinone oxidoreductase subunit 3 (chain A) [Archaeoglobus sulfaticallidus PM70-1]|uniref:NADH:ubiquinone oxidoreductase subunit 3 (Chain A) n=1 Tax=Archaeoglobus sulfaticallidus PM70-1 TaxID=387631 RepID=N0BN86_9EURY|nr:NADH-quinone oxidoreductase subunit A [Archaeoglobus sulfaticallidus]AGK61770.1 NADH:ubiquinone oxidoreductase subunit 3 (chain A) [Archaeoglobus sulfaticallidus PM70-1]
MDEYLTVMVYSVTVIAFAFLAYIVSRLLRPEKLEKEKYTTYECGEEPITPAWYQYSLQYYMYAILFVIFDVEILFLYPWALQMKNTEIFVAGMIFLFIVFVGLVYEWSKGILEWQKT